MIPTTGGRIGESYSATPGKRGDIAIRIVGERGITLAQALGARRAMSLAVSPEACFHFTPGRSKKWYRLWTAGFSAHSTRIEGVIHWRYNGQGRINLLRNEALQILKAREQLASITPPPPPPQITLCPPTKIN